VASAGNNQSVDEGTQVNFAGSATDAGADDDLTYEWDFDYDGISFDVDATGTNVSNIYADDADCGDGTCEVALRVTDDDGGFHIDTLDVDVANVAPVATAGDDQTVDEGATVNFTGSGSDVGADTLTYAWDLDGDGDFDDGTELSVSFVYDDDATVNVRLRVTDDEGDDHIDTLVVTVENVDPTADAGDDQTVGEGTEITLDATDSADPGAGDTLTYDWDLDGDGQYDDASGAVIMHTYDDEVTVNVGLRVQDDDGGEGTDTVQITVENVTPTVTAGDDIAASEGVEVSFVGSADDPGNDDLTYEWDLDGDGQYDDATGETAAYTYPDDDTVTVRLRVTDEDGAAGFDSLTVTVANVAPADVNAGGNRSADEGETLTFTGTATDVPADVLTYQWDFQDDGTFDASGASVDYAYPDDDAFTLRLRVTDDDGGQTETTVTVTVANVAPTDTAIAAVAQANEGSAVSFVGTTVDPGTGDTITYTWDFDDGGNDSGANVSHAFADEGDFTVTLDVADDDGGTDSDTHDIEILNVAPSVTMVEFVGVAQGVQTDFEATVTDPGDDTLFYTWDVICNDLVDQNDCNNGGEYLFGDDRVGQDIDSVPLTFNVIGSYTVTLSVDDQDGGVTADSTEVLVANEPPEVTLDADPTSLNEGQTVNFDGAATDPGGDDLTYAWNFGDGDTANGNLARAHTYDQDGVFTAVLRATDTSGESGQDSVEITVANVAPAPTVGDRTLEENVSAAFTVAIVDPGADDHSCVWDFGDSTDPVTDADCSGVAHTYVNDSVYTLQVTVNDGTDDGVGSATITVTNVAPTVLFANHQGVEGTPVTFTASADDRSPADVLSYTWRFGDGSQDVTTTEPTVAHTYDDNDAYSVRLTVNDGTDDVQVTRTATIANVAPTVFAGDDQTVNEGAEVSFGGTASDPGDDTLVYSWDLDGDGQFDDGDTRDVTYTYADDATVNVSFRVFDGDDTVTDTLRVDVENVAPTADAGANQNVQEGDTVTFAGAGTDPGDDTLTFNWDYDDGATEDDVGPTPTHTYAQEGVFRAELTVVDDDGGQNSNTVRIRVANVPPTVDLTAVGDDVAEGSQVGLSATVADPGADTLTYTWDFGDGDTAEDEDLDAVNHTWAQEGTYTVRLTVEDGTDSTTDSIVVNVVNVAPTVNAGDDVTINEGASVTFAPAIADPGDDTLTYSWTFADGDTSVERAPTHQFRQQGEYTVSLSVSDQTDTVTDTLVVTVNNVAPTVNAGNDATRAEGQEHAFSAVATDPGPDDVLTYHWDFGDGNTVSGRNLNQPRHTYVDDRPGEEDDAYTVVLRVEDRDGGSSTDTVVIRVNNVAPSVEAGINLVGNEGSLVVFDGGATDPGADTLTYTWDFGDGDSATGIELTQPTHIYGQDGNYTVTLTVDDGDGGVVADTMMVRVINVAPAVVAIEPSYSGIEGSEVSLAVRTFDPGDDTLHVVWNYRDTTTDEGDELTDVTHTWADDGIYDVIVTVTDGDGGQAVTVIRTTIANVAPSIQSLPALFGSQDVEYIYEPEAVDPGDDVLSWDLQDNPTGMVVDRNSGRLRWTPNLGHVNNQPEAGWRVLLRVRDDALVADTQEFFIDLAFTDDDNDGIADTCEALCVGDFEVGVQEDPEADFDNDGIDNRTECGQGTSICTSNAPAAPTPIAPEDGFLQEALPVTLVVQNAIDPDDDILTYTFEVFALGDTETPLFTSDPVPEGTAQTPRTIAGDDVTFEEDADYLWRCRASDPHASGPWSDLQRFRISLENNTPSVPMPVAPVGSANELLPVLMAVNAIDPEGETLVYDFQVFIVEDELPELIMESYANPEGEERSGWRLEMELEENESYQWRVRATDARSLSSRWSEMVAFLVNTENSLPKAPVLVYPAPNGAVATQPVVLVASEAIDDDGDELEYVFTLATDEGFADVIATSERLRADARREIAFEADAALAEDRAYYWQVQAFDADEGGGAVASRRFRFTATNAPPPAVTIQSPASGESVSVFDPDFVWLNVVEPDGDGVTYDLEIFADQEATQKLYAADEVAQADGDTTTWAGPSLADNSSFWWHVRAVDATGQEGAWSELTGFFVNVRNDAPEAPELEAPAIGEAVPAESAVDFAWINAFDSDGDPLTYTIEVFGVAGDAERQLRETDIAAGDGASTTWTATDLLPPGTYSWHVRASDGQLDGPWSLDGVFAVAEDAPDDMPDAGPDTGVDPGNSASYPDKTAACGCETPSRPPRTGAWALLVLAVVVGIGGRGWLSR
jgi:PKD repeat protein